MYVKPDELKIIISTLKSEIKTIVKDFQGALSDLKRNDIDVLKTRVEAIEQLLGKLTNEISDLNKYNK